MVAKKYTIEKEKKKKKEEKEKGGKKKWVKGKTKGRKARRKKLKEN